MYRIMIQKRRSLIVDKKMVLKGGKERVYPKVKGPSGEMGAEHIDVELSPGRELYEVTDELGKILEKYDDVVVVDVFDAKGKRLELPASQKAKEPTLDFALQQIATQQQQIQEMLDLIKELKAGKEKEK